MGLPPPCKAVVAVYLEGEQDWNEIKNVFRSICNVFLGGECPKKCSTWNIFSLYFSRKGKCIDIFKAATL